MEHCNIEQLQRGQRVRPCNITAREKALPDSRAEGCEKTRGSGVKRGLWGQIFILDFGEHRRDRAFQPARKNEDRIKLAFGVKLCASDLGSGLFC